MSDTADAWGGQEVLEEARELMERADSICVLSGAGVSAESGVPTFRGDGGLWKSHRAEELATPGAFRRDPRLVWEWYEWRRELIRECRPNPGHHALARLAMGSTPVHIVTQNVDGLHEKAGMDVAPSGGPSPSPPLELHGSIFRVKCTTCTYAAPHRDRISSGSVDELPTCPACSDLLRPAVVWFGESLDPEVLNRAFQVAREASLCLVVGTSAVVQPAASVPLATLEGGGTLIEVNPTETPLTPMAHFSFRGASGEVLPALLEGLV